MKYVCPICGYVYDEEREGIPFSELTQAWKCPLCGAPKSSFRPKDGAQPQEAAGSKVKVDADMEELSAGELAAIFSNLARGCEKQYMFKEAELFTKIAGYYTSAASAVEEASLDRLTQLLERDLEKGYPSFESTASNRGDRGARRVRVWGEKVTNMLNILLEQYKEEGEEALRGTRVWVCSVCGFVYIGDEPPKICPVCKVPDWKFEEIEGRH